MDEIFKLVAQKTRHRMLTVRLQDTPDAPLEFDVLVKFDKSKLLGPLTEERYALLSTLAEQLDVVLRAHDRVSAEK